MKKLWRIVAAVAALGLLGATAGVAYAHKAAATGTVVGTVGTTYAVVVGISDYNDACGSIDLSYARWDAEAFYIALTDDDPANLGDPHSHKTATNYNYDIPKQRVTLLRDSGATRAAVIGAIESAIDSAGSNDDVVIYFSGHGTRVIGSGDGDNEMVDNAMVTYDCANGRHTVITDTQLKNLITTEPSAGPKRVVVILDISFPSGFVDDLKQVGNVLYIAAAKGEATEVGGPIEHGVFSYLFVVKGILQGEADNLAYNPDATDDDKIPFEEAYDYTFHNARGFLAQKPNIVDNLPDDVLITS